MVTEILGIPQLLYYIADFDSIWIPIKRLPPEGEMFIVVKGGPEGPFAQVLESVPEYDFNKITNVFDYTGSPTGTSQDRYLARNGIGWTGFNRRLLMKDISYDKWEKLPNSPNMGLVPKKREGPSIYFQYLMATKVEGAETSDNFPVDVIIMFTVRLINPVKALFFAGGWSTQVTGAIQGDVREYIGTKDINQLRKEKIEKPTGPSSSGMITRIKSIDLMTNFGLEIVEATFVEYDLVTGGPKDQEMADAIRAKGIAKEEGDAKVIMAEREAEAQRLKAIGEKNAMQERAAGIEAEYKARVSAGGEFAGEFARAEAIKETKLQVLGGDFVSSREIKSK